VTAGPRFCVLFDQRYLTRGLALYHSLAAHTEPPFVLWALCLDDVTYDVLAALSLPEVRPVRLADLERRDTGLAAAAADRSRLEYFWTCKSAWLMDALARDGDAGSVTYLDSDLFFFDDARRIEDERGAGAVLIVPHRFPPALSAQVRYGTYNAGLLSFRRGDGEACLRWWRERCLEWCRDEVSRDRYSDQRYLEGFAANFEGVAIAPPGLGMGPWNASSSSIEASRGRVRVDGQPLVAYHFHGLRVLGRFLYDPGRYPGLQGPILRHVYRPYLRALRRAWSDVRALVPGGLPLAEEPRWPWASATAGAGVARAVARRQVRFMPVW